MEPTIHVANLWCQIFPIVRYYDSIYYAKDYVSTRKYIEPRLTNKEHTS